MTYLKKRSSTILKVLVLTFVCISLTFASGPVPTTSTGTKPKEIVNVAGLEAILTKPQRPRKGSLKIETKYFKIEVQDFGAIITSFKHLDDSNPLKAEVELIKDKPFQFLIYPTIKGKTPQESQLLTSQAVSTLKSLNYNLTKTETDSSVTITASAPVRIKVSGRARSANIVKTFTFFKELHFWKFDWDITGVDTHVSELYFSPFNTIGPAGSSNTDRTALTEYNFYYTVDEFEKFQLAEGGGFFNCYGGEVQEEETKHVKQSIGYFGTASRFMLMSAQPLNKTQGLYSFKSERQLQLALSPSSFTDAATGKLSFVMFTGPKVKEFLGAGKKSVEAFPELGKLHDDIDKAFDFGITGPVRDAIVWFLQILYKVIPNYGIGIILFALLFKLVFWPLNQKQAESMKKMQALQPQLKELNEKYKDNPQEKQRRTMALYKEKKVNPLGGCLPMVIQLPIFIALYSAFSDAYELWKSPFISGWINDLSEPDTVYTFAKSLPLIGGMNLNILPLLMTGSQFLQSKFTMVSGGDGQQKLMMQLMPLMLLFFFWSMPSGVVLYWTVQNLLSIAQQIYTNRREDKAAAQT